MSERVRTELVNIANEIEKFGGLIDEIKKHQGQLK